MYVELHTAEALKAHWGRNASLHNVVCQNIDLRDETVFLRSVSARGAVFLGCQLEGPALEHILATCGLVFPRIKETLDLPYDPYRAHLYRVPELMAGFDAHQPGSFFGRSLDGQIYTRFQKYREADDTPTPILEALAQRLHDHAIDDALYELLLEYDDVVAIMGGHRMVRGERKYRELAWMGRELTRGGMLVATGGGPGAMEAANLGAWLAPHDDDALDRAIELLEPSPGFDDDPEAYIGYGYRVLHELVNAETPNDHGATTLAIPTWFYGHEPTNVFATHIAKYFANSIREDGLVGIANRGIVFAPGRAGTVQEIFQDATQNYYGTCKVISPMVLFGDRYWSDELPVVDALHRLGEGKPMGALLRIEDDPETIVRFLQETEPVDH